MPRIYVRSETRHGWSRFKMLMDMIVKWRNLDHSQQHPTTDFAVLAVNHAETAVESISGLNQWLFRWRWSILTVAFEKCLSSWNMHGSASEANGLDKPQVSCALAKINKHFKVLKWHGITGFTIITAIPMHVATVLGTEFVTPMSQALIYQVFDG